MERRTLTLTEYETSAAIQLSPDEAGWLHHHVQGLALQPALHSPGMFHLTASSHVGTVALPALTILIRPKVPVDSVLFLISYALESLKWQRRSSSLMEQDDLVEGMAAFYGNALQAALTQGVFQSYRNHQEALNAVRGRIRFDEQLRRRFLAPMPLEVEYDDFTIDTDLNRLLYATLRKLRRVRIRSAKVRASLAVCTSAFADGVAPVDVTPKVLDGFEWNRLNQRFKPAAELAATILACTSVEIRHGAVSGTAFLINMNTVFEEFVRSALRDALKLPRSAWPVRRRAATLDYESSIVLEPDLTWIERERTVFVGDAKYKRVLSDSAPNPDMYQLNAYVTAFGLPAGLLIYAEGPDSEAVHTVRNTRARLITRTIDISGQASEVLAAIQELAERIQGFRDEESIAEGS